VQNDTEGSIAAFENAYKREKSAGSARQLAKAYYALDRREDAMAIMLDWLGAAPSDAASRLMLAMSLQKWGMNDKSIEQYRLLKESQPDNVIVLNNLAWLYFLKNDARALDTAQRAYDLDAKRAEVADTYGWILLKMGDDPEKALQVLQQAYVNFPTSSEIGYHVAVALHEVKRDKEAVRTLRKVIWEGESFDEIEQAKALLKSLGG
jgi:Tfp pilus assembly protein PilF